MKPLAPTIRTRTGFPFGQDDQFCRAEIAALRSQ
jgi:hypothetical protein